MDLLEQQIRERDSSYPVNIPEHWSAIRDRRILLAEVDYLRAALEEIVLASRNDGLAVMCNWMRDRAWHALSKDR